MQELTTAEVQEISGGGEVGAAAVVGIGVGVGMAAFGTSWGSVAVGLAFAVSPLSVAAILCAGGYAGYLLMQK